MSIFGRPNIPAEWIGEIPTRPSAQKALVVSVASAMLAGLGGGMWAFGPRALTAFLANNADAAALLAENDLSGALFLCFPLFGIVGLICAACGILSLVRIAATYHLLRAALALVYPAVTAYVVIVWMALFSIMAKDLEIDGMAQDRATVLVLWWKLCWPALAVGVYVAWLHVMLRSRSVYAAFTRTTGLPMKGDRALEDWRTHGRDPRSRRSLYASITTHVTVLVVIPYLLQARGCVEPYRVPKGSGTPSVASVKVAKKKKPKKKQTLSLRPNSDIYYDIPDLDHTEVDEVMDEASENTYESSQFANKGNLGKGGGKDGGWPQGMDDYKIRFIRLEHSGVGWDDGMNETGADMNFLRAFARITKFKKIASKSESHPISMLADYPADGFPPFVFLTGNGNMGRVSSNDQKILREYCLNGGMLIADAGSDSFDRTFRDFIKKLFRDKPLVDIADDEMIFQLPFGFPDGAPAFWHHGGRRALGMRHEGRWIVFYHPGDMNDAWKSPGYSGVTPEMRDAAIHLGVNLLYYAYNQWDDAVAKVRK